MKIYLLGCLVAFLLLLLAPYKKWKRGYDIILSDVIIVLFLTLCSYVTCLVFLFSFIFDNKDKVIIKNKSNKR